MGNTHTKALIALLFVGVLMGALDLAIIGPALPAIQAEFGMDNRQLAVLFNAYVLCQMIGSQLLAKLSDRFGPRLIYVFSIGLFAAGSLLLVVAGDKDLLYVGRAIQGFGAGGIFPVASAVIGSRLPVEERGPALGLLGTVFGVAFIAGPILGGILLNFSWHWLFLVNLPIAAVLAIGAMKLIPATSERPRKPFDVAGAITLSVGLTALVVAVNQLDTTLVFQSLASWPVLPLMLVVALALPTFWSIEKRAADPIVRPGFFASRQIVIAGLISAGVGAMQAAGVFYPSLAVSAIGLSQSNAALLLLPGVLASTLASPVAGRLINVVGTRTVVSTSLAMICVSFVVYGSAHIGLGTFLLANVLGGLGLAGLLGAPLRFIVLSESRPEERGAAQGLLSVFSSAGRLLGAATVGAVATAGGGGTAGYQSAFIGMAILAGILFLAAIRLRPHADEDTGEPKVAQAA